MFMNIDSINEVVHAHWIYGNKWQSARCSNCDKYCLAKRRPFDHAIDIHSEYCPHCGARMINGDKEAYWNEY